MPKKPPKLSDFRPQSQNANSHTERGLWALEESIPQNGWIGSITTSADGEVFDGSARIEKAFDLFGDDVEPIVVEIDGTRPVIMKRMDIATADDPKAKLLAISANRVAELNLNWNPDILSGLDGEVNISGLFTGDELKALSVAQEKPKEEEWGEALGGLPSGEKEPFQQMTFTLHDEQAEQVKRAIEVSKKMGDFDTPNQNSNGNALARICEIFLSQND